MRIGICKELPPPRKADERIAHLLITLVECPVLVRRSVAFVACIGLAVGRITTLALLI